MEGTAASNKPWDHAWSTEEMRKNRRDWSLAGDSGLLKHLQQFSENLEKKANETQDAINSMVDELNETTILVDNLTNTSLALANTQFIESRVQEDNVEIEQPVEDLKKNKNEHELSASNLLSSVCESIRQGLIIMDEKYEKVEVIASDSEDEDDNTVPSVILRPKDPYQERPLPYVIGTEQWKSSNKIGLESSSSESEQNDEEDSASESDDKNVLNIRNTNTRTNLGIGRMSSTSSESNDYNIESSSIKDTDKTRLYARSQDTLNSDTEPTTPSSILPTGQNVSNGPPSFAEELAKRLGSVLPAQKNVIVQESNEQVPNHSKDDIFSPSEDQDIFSNKSDNLFSKGKNLFSDEQPSSSWKNKPVRPVNTNLIPPSIDMPPPLSIVSSAPKSNIDDLFGDADDSEDSDDIFSKKASKDIFASEREGIKSEIANKQKNLSVANDPNSSNMATSTPDVNDRGKGLFEDEDDDDLFKTTAKQVKPPDAPLSGSTKKKPVGGVSIFGKVDIMSSSKFARRPSTSSSSSESIQGDQPRVGLSNSETVPKSDNSSAGTASNVLSSLEAGNNNNNTNNNASNMSNSATSSSGISVRQPSIDNTAGSSLGADFQPLMSSSRLKSEEYYRERVVSDSVLAATNSSTSSQQQQQQQTEDASEHEDVFGPPPLPKATDLRPKSKVASLFDDSDSGDDLFASASPSSRSLKSSERTPSKTSAAQEPPVKRKGLFDDEDDLFAAPRDAPDVDLFGVAPVKNLSKVGAGLFDDVDESSGAGFKSEVKSAQFENKTKSEDKSSLFDDKPTSKSTVNSLFSDEGSLFGDSGAKKADNQFGASGEDEKEPVNKPESRLFNEPAKVEKTHEKKSIPKGLFEDLDDSEDSDLFGKSSKPIVIDKAGIPGSSNSKSLFDDTSDSDLFGASKSASDKNVEKVGDNIFGDSKSSSELFSSQESTVPERKAEKAEPPKSPFAEKPKTTKPKRLNTSIFDDSDDDVDDLFGGSSFTKKTSNKKVSSIFGEDDSAEEMEEDKKSEAAESEKKTDTKKVPSDKNNEVESKKFISKIVSEKKNSLFDDDDDDDDLFGDKKKKSSASEKPMQENKSIKNDAAVNAEVKKTLEPRANTNPTAKPDVASKKAIFAEIQQKLERHKLDQSEKQGKSDPSVVDGAVSSKREPPKTLKLQTTLPTPDPDEPNKDQQATKKPTVSGKIKNLQGKVGGLKLFSPTDTPPLFRKNVEEKSSGNNEEESETPTTAMADQASSGASTPSLPSGDSSPHTSGTNSRTRDSPSLKSDNTELAVSFDEPVRSDTLASTSKSRARIQAKRRPQSRQARHEALRHSGIDFDVIDASDTSPVNQLNGNATDAHEKVDRLQPLSRLNQTEGSSRLAVDSAHMDDRSELSVSRNTTTNLLSPSTDEEDLFDVPPDLPEDPKAKEDALFGRAPILSPIEPIDKPKPKVKESKKEDGRFERKTNVSLIGGQERRRESDDEEKKELIDPLRDENHDPLKDPSQLFAFVTKTPSPEKSKGLLVNEDDDSLFSSSFKSSEKTEKKSKAAMDLFVDEDDGSSNDLFSSSKENVKKPLKDTKIDLFDDDALEDDDSLFGSASKKTNKTSITKSSPGPSAAREVQKIAEKTDIKSTKPTVQDIFDSSSDEDDIFSKSKKTIPKKKATSLFDDDPGEIDDNDIFGKSKSSSSQDIVATPDSGRPVVKKAVTRDLKKTAEKIVEDPLSMLQND